MEHESNPFIPLLIVISLAFIVPIALSRFKKLQLPIVVGEILAGVLIGRSGFGLVSPDEPMLTFVAEFGFVFLMFLSGMEIDFQSLGMNVGARNKQPRQGWSPIQLAGVSFGLTLVFSALISLGLVRLGLARNPWMMGLVLSTTSLGVVVPVLKERNLIGGTFGQALLISALVADFATMFLITVVIAVLSQGLTFDILLIGLLFVAFFLTLRFARIINKIPGFQRVFEELSATTAQIKIRGAFTIMLAFVVLASALGTEIILGAFIAGACIALLNSPGDETVRHQLESIGYGFLIPIFFIKVGIDFNFSVLLNSKQAMFLAPLLLAAAISVKVLPVLIFRLQFSWRETLAAGALLSARLSLIIAASAIGTRLGVISEATNAAILLVAIITVTLAPLTFNAIAPKKAGPAKRVIVVAGAGELGLQVAEQLRAHAEQVTVIDREESRVNRARERGFTAALAQIDGDDPAAAQALAGAATLVCTYADTDLAYQICATARNVYGINHVVAHITTPGEIARFSDLGISTTNAAMDHSAILTMLARNPATYALLTRTDDNKEIYEVRVENPLCISKKLRQIRLPGDTLVLAVRRNGDLLVPHGNTQLEKGDFLTLVSSLEWVALGKQLFGEY